MKLILPCSTELKSALLLLHVRGFSSRGLTQILESDQASLGTNLRADRFVASRSLANDLICEF